MYVAVILILLSVLIGYVSYYYRNTITQYIGGVKTSIVKNSIVDTTPYDCKNSIIDFTSKSDSYKSIDIGMLQRDSPNIKIVRDYCSLGKDITSKCSIDDSEYTQYENPKIFPDISKCNGIDDCENIKDKQYTFSKLCSTDIECTLKFSDFYQTDYRLTDGNPGDSVFNRRTGELRENIDTIDANIDVTKICDYGNDILKSCKNKKYIDTVSTTPSFKFYCCENSDCVGEECIEECKGSCSIDKLLFSQNSRYFLKRPIYSVPIEKIKSFCSLGEGLKQCKIDKYHPLSEQSLVLNPQDPVNERESIGGIYSKFCENNQCLQDYRDFIDDTENIGNYFVKGEYIPNIDSSLVNSVVSCDGDSCMLNSLGERVFSYCNKVDSYLKRGCLDYKDDKIYHINSSYPPIDYSMNYISMCCLEDGLRNDSICEKINRENLKNAKTQLENHYRDKTSSGVSIQKDIYQNLSSSNKRLIDL